MSELKSLCGNCKIGTSAAEEAAEKVEKHASGVKTPDETAGFMSELKFRPPKETAFFRSL